LLTVEHSIFVILRAETPRIHNQSSTHTYRLSKFLKNRCHPAAKKRDYDQTNPPRQAPQHNFYTPPKNPAKPLNTAK